MLNLDSVCSKCVSFLLVPARRQGDGGGSMTEGVGVANSRGEERRVENGKFLMEKVENLYFFHQIRVSH